MPRLIVVAGVLLVAACEGPTYPTAPPIPASAPLVAKALHIVVSPGELPIGGGDATLSLEATTGAFGAGVKDVRIALAVTDGTLERAEAVTDGTGHAKVRWSGTRSSRVTATSGALLATTTIHVRESTPPAPAPPPPNRPNPPPTDPLPPIPPPPEIPDSNLVLTVTTNPSDVVLNQPVTFSAALATLDGSDVPGIARHTWDFNGDRLPDSSSASPSHTFTSPGPHQVLLEIVTANRHVATATMSIEARTTALTVGLTSNAGTVAPGDPVTFTATASVPVLTYEWDFEDDGTVDDTTPVATTASYATIGTKTARVRVRAADGRTATAQTTVTVTAPALVVGLTVSSASPHFVTTPLTLTATVTSSGPVPSPLTFEWDYENDGTIDAVTTSATPGSAMTTYSTIGTKTAKVTVRAADGRTASNTVIIQVI